jgi:hypothetical protein
MANDQTSFIGGARLCRSAASGQTEAKVDTAAVLVEVKKTCAQRPSRVLASAVWTAYLDLNKR